MPYFIRWLDKTFKSKKQTEELLTPELQNGTLTSHDYELSVGFLPGNHRYYGELGGVGLGAFVFYYGLHGNRLFTHPFTAFSLAPLNPTSTIKPRIKPPQLAALTITAYLAGKIIGQVARLRAHIHFTKSLENPSGFETAMESVYARSPDAVSGKKLGFSVGWDVPDSGGGNSAQGGIVGEVLGMRGHEEVIRRKKRMEEEAMGGFSSDSAPVGQETFGMGGDADNTPFPSSPSSAFPPSPSSSSRPPTSDTTDSSSSPAASTGRPKSKWDEIRAANARGAAPSSWDAIRQSHERTRVRNPNSSSDYDSPDNHTTSSSYGGNSSYGGTGDSARLPRDVSIPSGGPPYHDTSRAEEQAKFDAMLEAERNVKSNE